MPSFRSITRTIILSFSALILSTATPFAALAAADGCTPPDSSQPGVHRPVGADAGTYTYQCDGPYAGMWSNGYYVYNPDTYGTTPIYSPDYAYNCASGTWTKAEWDYAAADGQYHLNRVPSSAPSGVATNCPVAASPASTGGGGASGDGATANGPNNVANAGINNTGPNGSSNLNTALNNNLTLNNVTNASMNNTIGGVAISGNSLVLGNTSAGGATTGDTQNLANVVNMLQSSSNALGSGSNVITFTANINGDVNGDLFLDPSQLSNVQNASSNTDLNSNVTVNNASNTNIDNKINLASTSGDATVSSNTNGGDATTGNAKAIANIVNSINSALTAGKSFIGTININGNLNGDILLPENFVDTLLAANVPTVTITGPGSTNTTNTNVNSNTTVTNTNNLGITNNVNANANTGSANVSNNTSGGNAQTGNASTNITAFNLTGSKVIGANDILVFVNAPDGRWVGLIVNAPSGATAASLGGGITTSGPNSTNTSNTNVNDNTTINNKVNAKINNDITTNATSGNADVNSNTKGGNARSGNADSRVNLANIENSQLTLSGWLGILFINVFGTWHGSFGVNTSAGDPIVATAAAASAAGTTPGGSGFNTPAQVFRFQANGGGGGSGGSGNNSSSNGGAAAASTNGSGPSSALLAAQTVRNQASAPQLQSAAHNSLGKTLAVIGGLTIFYILVDAFLTTRKERRAKASFTSAATTTNHDLKSSASASSYRGTPTPVASHSTTYSDSTSNNFSSTYRSH